VRVVQRLWYYYNWVADWHTLADILTVVVVVEEQMVGNQHVVVEVEEVTKSKK
jgi:hypothetical protein